MSIESCGNSAHKSPGHPIQKFFVVLGNTLFILLMLLIISMIFFLVQSKVAGGPPNIFGRYMYIVLSGSMSPTFDTGSVVFVKPMEPEQVRPGDVITFTSLDDARSLTTHRVVDINNTDPQNIQFTTKGDANQVTDPGTVSGDRLVGTMNFSIPYLGYLMNFGQTKKGLLVLIIVPGAFLILTELQKLYVNTRKSKEKDDDTAA